MLLGCAYSGSFSTYGFTFSVSSGTVTPIDAGDTMSCGLAVTCAPGAKKFKSETPLAMCVDDFPKLTAASRLLMQPVPPLTHITSLSCLVMAAVEGIGLTSKLSSSGKVPPKVACLRPF